ncbi:hypothetical protein HAX54_028556 [Datura stramonium]|uniref:Uncharacterized protein n=1 Tax=Datura stramonium TaxID=4076 RepID=A0ABS8S9M5_DATST|nr:hypothetical protein [Datura stramonium]
MRGLWLPMWVATEGSSLEQHTRAIFVVQGKPPNMKCVDYLFNSVTALASSNRSNPDSFAGVPDGHVECEVVVKCVVCVGQIELCQRASVTNLTLLGRRTSQRTNAMTPMMMRRVKIIWQMQVQRQLKRQLHGMQQQLPPPCYGGFKDGGGIEGP